MGQKVSGDSEGGVKQLIVLIDMTRCHHRSIVSVKTKICWRGGGTGVTALRGNGRREVDRSERWWKGARGQITAINIINIIILLWQGTPIGDSGCP